MNNKNKAIMNTETQRSNRPFRNLLFSVLLLIATFFYTFFRLQLAGSLTRLDNMIIFSLIASGIFFFIQSSQDDKMRLDKI